MDKLISQEALSALTEEAILTNHPSGDACRHWLRKIKTPKAHEALATAKAGLETLIALLKEDKPAVFVDPVTGVVQKTAVMLSKVEANQAEYRAEGERLSLISKSSGQDVDTASML